MSTDSSRLRRLRRLWGMGGAGGDHLPAGAAPRRFGDESTARLFEGLVHWRRDPDAVRAALDRLETEPLASAGHFRGDLLRRLMELPAGFWAREPAQYERYRAVLRAAAATRRALPEPERRAFYQDLPPLPPADDAR